MKKIVIILTLISMMLLSSCTIDVNGDFEIFDNDLEQKNVGDFKTYNEIIEQNNNEDVFVNFKFNAAKVNINKSEENLFEGYFKTNISDFTPKVEFNNNKLYFDDSYRYKIIGKSKKYWDIKLSDKVKTSIDITSNACDNSFDFTNILIKDMNLNLNASNTDIRFDEKNKEDLDMLGIKVNSGKVDVYGLDNGNADNIDIDANASKVSLYFGSDISKNTDIKIKANASSINIDLPENLGIKVELKSALTNLDIHKKDIIKLANKTYKSDKYDDSEIKINIYIDSNVSSIDIR